jgi:vitamin B12 transporter
MLDKIRRLLCTIAILACTLTSNAQEILSDSIYQVEEVIVSANRLSAFATGSKIEVIDSNVLQQNSNNSLADLLAQQTQVFVKSYSIAGLSTPSFRGTNANQTAILWNGFNLSSPMNGGLDLALMPVNFANNIKLQYGGSGALWGSGAIGGTIHLNNTPTFNKGFSASTSLSYGSFDDYQENVAVAISTKKFISTTSFFHREAKNNFKFTNTAKFGKPSEYLKNAEIRQDGILQENYFKINKHQNISFRLWYQNNNRNIPASMTSKVSEATQNDASTRSTLEWQRIKENTS